MSSVVIPANPGFAVKWTKNGIQYQEPVIAWLVNADAVDPTVTPIGVAGLCDDSAEVYHSNRHGEWVKAVISRRVG